MRKILFVFGLLFFAYAAQADHVKIEKKNGGPCGYNKVTESHTANGHDLTCSGSGNEKCTWEYPPKMVDGKPVQSIMEVIEQQITNGFKGGTLYIKTYDLKVEVSGIHVTGTGVIDYVAEFDY